MDAPPKPTFDETYFETHTYANVTFAKYSMYWWSNRFFSALARRHGRAGSRLLEVGCGLGHLVGQLEPHFETCAVDINPWALRDARKVAPHTPLLVASAEELPYAAGAFGVILIKHIVEHLPNPEKAITELARLLEPGGLFILATPNLASLLKPLKGDRWIGYQDPTHIALKPPEEWLSLITGAGLTLQRVFSDGFWDVPYVPLLPAPVQKILFGSLGGLQALSTFVFLPMRWGESIIVLARKQSFPETGGAA